MTDKALKLLALALDSAAHKGEIANAAVMFIHELRKEGIGPDILKRMLDGSAKPQAAERPAQAAPKSPSAKQEPKKDPQKRATGPHDWFWPWGKHRGKSLSQTPDEYLHWSLKNMENLADRVKCLIRQELEIRKKK